MSGNITLTSTQRGSLLSLQDTSRLSERTTLRLSTGRSVNSVAEGAVAFFRSKSLTNRASDLADRKNDISQGVTALNAALEGTDAVDSLLKQLRGVVEGSRSSTNAERQDADVQFRSILVQISELVNDTSYQGLNLLNNSKNVLSVRFSDRTQSILNVSGFDFNASSFSARSIFYHTGLNGVTFNSAPTVYSTNGAVSASTARIFSAFLGSIPSGSFGSFNDIGANNSRIDVLDTFIKRIDSAISRVRSNAATIGNNAAVLETRLNFTTRYVSRLQGGADSLVLADLNEEGANLLALQTRQQLGVKGLTLASEQQQAVLQLVR